MALVATISFAILFKQTPVQNKPNTAVSGSFGKKEKKKTPKPEKTKPTEVFEFDEPDVPSKEEDVSDLLQLDSKRKSPLRKGVEKKEKRGPSPQKKSTEPEPEVYQEQRRPVAKDLQQGFVVVAKKGPPPLTAEQKRERDETRRIEEETKLANDKAEAERRKNRDKQRAEAAQRQASNQSAEALKDMLAKQKEEKQVKQTEWNFVIKKPADPAIPPPTSKSWGPVTTGNPTVDESAYPSLTDE
eukprot:NODE_3764_length_905_cov_212.469152_g3611_i0.p1 GENE.NODE_3764_length_905_cov_212.469152_g3611_i0~~NODE_3764_length_905_cov_212.469152_g3611_i0.p1  ORF type:complete len:265 (+),score=66.18 NODE_3764_length_905_cov_212.469152_g3611_i0:67-795(+)